MGTIALVLLAAWAVALLVSRRRSLSGHPAAPRWNGGLLLATLLLAMATCIVPAVPFISGYGEVAKAPPAEKRLLMDQVLADTGKVMGLALLSIPLIALGVVQHARNRRRIGEAKGGTGSSEH